jgi:hypothetical protein
MEINKTLKSPMFTTASNLPTRILCVQSPSKVCFYELKNLQSDKWCYPVKTIFEKDNQETYEEHFDSKFSFVRRVYTLGIPALGWKPFKIGEPSDMKAH